MFLNFLSRQKYPREEQGIFKYRSKERKAKLTAFCIFFCQPLQLYLLFTALYLKKKKSLFPYLFPLQVLLFSDTMTRPHDKKTNQGWDLCKFYISAKFHQNNSPGGLTGEIQQKNYFTFLKTRVPQNTSSKTPSEPESQPNISFSATFIAETQTSVQAPLART